MADGEDMKRRKVLKTLGLTGAASASVLSGRAYAENVSGNETEGYGSDGEKGTISILGKTERVDLTDNPDLGERIWPVNTDASGGVCRPAAGGTKPATGEGSATWFGFGGCGTWKVFDVQPGETYKIISRIDTCFDCVLFDDAYAVQEFVDGSWETQESHPAIKAKKTNARVVEYTPDSDRIRIKNLNGNRGIGFYLRVYGPDDSTSPERRIAEKFAPTFSFDADEKFLPTDPTRFTLHTVEAGIDFQNPESDADYKGYDDFDFYEPEENLNSDEDRFVTYPRTELYGPDALAEYVNSSKDDPTVFYNVVESLDEDGELHAVSYWQYYAFDQYVNVHWHDWEVLHIFFDGDIEKPEETEPVMAVASAHAAFATNNEFTGLDKEKIGILSELGSHANATDIASPDSDTPDGEFDRGNSCSAPVPGTIFCEEETIDITNIDSAYGLPRNEGDEEGEDAGSPRAEAAAAAAYYQPTINGDPIQDLDIFPSDVSEEDLIDSNAPDGRNQGRILEPDDYEIAPMEKVSYQIDEFTGPAFDEIVGIPFLELSSFKTVGEPWKEENFSNPIGVVSDRGFLEQRYDIPAGGLTGLIRGALQDTRSGTDGEISSEKFASNEETLSDSITDDIKENANVTSAPPSEEAVVAVQSEPRVGPTSNGRVVVNDLELGEHKLGIGSPNREPYGQVINIDEERNLAGVSGRVFMVPDEESTEISGSVPDEQTIANITVTEDYLGDVFDAEPLGENRFNIFVHQDGAYTVEVETDDGETGAYRIIPENKTEIKIEEIDTGKLVLSQYLVDYLRDTAEDARDLIDNENINNGNDGENGNGGGRIANSIAVKFEAAADAAERAVEAIESGRGNTERRSNNQLDTVSNQLDAVENELDAQRGKKVGEAEYLILADRLEQARGKVD